jgi:Putative quorum-sensing-regulated virulence factor
MPFGKFRGVFLADLPDEYLHWLYALDGLREPLHSAVDREWRIRFAEVQPAAPLPADVRPMVDEIITGGYRVLASRHHPDRGGETKTMQMINEAAAWLRRIVRGAPS